MSARTDIPSWDDYFMGLAFQASGRSKDPDTQVGAVIVSPERDVLSTGYNGLVRGANDNIDQRWSRVDGEKYHWCEHAERNAIFGAARRGVALEGAILYCTLLPCMDCARAIIQAGITEVVTDREGYEVRSAQDNRWEASHSRTLELLEETGVTLTWWTKS